MTKKKNISLFIYLLICFCVSLNGYYIIEDIMTLTENIDKNISNIVKSNIALNLSWIIIYIWFILKPVQRKDILIISLVPMVLTNILHNYDKGLSQVILNICIVGLLCCVYLLAYKLLTTEAKEIAYT